jgi:hypothetical protein
MKWPNTLQYFADKGKIVKNVDWSTAYFITAHAQDFSHSIQEL